MAKSTSSKAAPVKKPASSKGAATPAAAAGNTRSPQRGVRRRNREQTIRDILDAAESLLDRKGPDGFGLAELGREAGISFGLIHHYFGGKEGLLRAVLKRTLRRMGRRIADVQERESVDDRRAPVVDIVWETFAETPGFSRLLAWGLLTGLLTGEDVAEEFEVDRAAVRRMVDTLRADVPGATMGTAAATATLLLSAALGFSLLRPALVSGYRWSETTDRDFRENLVRAMEALSKPQAADTTKT